MKRALIALTVAGAAAAGAWLGGGAAEAKIEPGHYKSTQPPVYGFIPVPQTNYTVIGDRAYSDFGGVGPWNAYSYRVKHTPNGGVIYRDTPNGMWLGRMEFTKVRGGFQGKNYGYNILLGPIGLKRVR